jgi:hypothetical protein
MNQKKPTATKTNPKNPEATIRILKEDQTGKLTYQVGADDRASVYVRISENHGGGFFSDEWVPHADILRRLNLASLVLGFRHRLAQNVTLLITQVVEPVSHTRYM